MKRNSPNLKKFFDFLIRQRIALILIVIVLIITVATSDFWTLRNQQNLGVALAIDGIMVVGMTVVMVGAGLDLSVGSVMALAGVLSVSLQEPLGLSVAIAAAISMGALAGIFNGLLVTKVGINPFIATLGTMIAVRGMAMTYTDGRPMANTNLAFVELGRGKIGIFPIPLLVFLVALIIGYLFLTHTQTGREVYALGGNEDAARASGIRTNRIKFISYLISGLTAGISGVILASRLSTGSPIIGEDTPLSVITAVLLGGTSLTGGVGTIGGSLLGLLTVGSLSNGLSLLNVPAYYQRVAKGLLLIIVIIIDSLYAQSRKRALHRTRGLHGIKTEVISSNKYPPEFIDLSAARGSHCVDFASQS